MSANGGAGSTTSQLLETGLHSPTPLVGPLLATRDRPAPPVGPQSATRDRPILAAGPQLAADVSPVQAVGL